MKKVFICHLTEDNEIVGEISQMLKSYKIDTWVDYDDLLPGESWEEKIIREIETTNAILICLSKAVFERESYVHKEIKFALDRADKMPPGKIFIIPLIIDKECPLHPRLKHIQHVKTSEPDWFQRILKTLNIDLNQKQVPLTYKQKRELIEEIETDKDELLRLWRKRNEFPKYSDKYYDFDEIAEIVGTRIINNSEKIGEYFDGAIHYRKLQIEQNKLKGKRNSEFELYIDRGCICVPKEFIDKRIYIVNKDDSPVLGSAAKGKVVNHVKSYIDENGKKHFLDLGDGWVNYGGIIQKGYSYDVYDDFNEGAFLIGTLNLE